MCRSPWGCRGSDRTERLANNTEASHVCLPRGDFGLRVGGEQAEPLQVWLQPLILFWAGRVGGPEKTSLSVPRCHAGYLLFLRETRSREQAAGSGRWAQPHPLHPSQLCSYQ